MIAHDPSIALFAHALSASLQGQAQGPELEATVDMDRVAVGEELTYTVRAVSHSPAPTHVSIEPFTGLELVARSESTELAFGDPSTRTTILEIRLRAVRPGRWRVGPARRCRAGTPSRRRPSWWMSRQIAPRSRRR